MFSMIQMLNLLGVPKAVLEYVLFCHQEESNWSQNLTLINANIIILGHYPNQKN